MAKSKNLRAVLAGCGGMANAWMSAVEAVRGVDVIGLVDVQPKAAEQFAAKYELADAHVGDSVTKAIKATGADVMFDVTVPDAHHKVVIDALRAGCNVLGEKPMTTTLARARKMVAEAEKAGRIYAVIQNRRYEPKIRAVSNFVRKGGLGAIEEIHGDFYIGAPFGGFRAEMDYPLILDMAIHTFDAARFLVGAEPQSVYCHSWNPGHSWYRGDASAACIFEMSDNIVYTYRGSWCNEGMQTSWNTNWRIVGEKGTVLWDGAEGVEVEIQKKRSPRGHTEGGMKKISVPVKPMKFMGHAGLMDDFKKAVRSGKKPMTTCEDNIKSLAMVLGAVKSAKAARRVQVEW